MNTKRTGILTLSSAQNYGAVLQSFSLMRFIQDNYGDTEIIDFTPSFILGRYSLIRIENTSITSAVFSFIKGIIKLPIPLLTRIRFECFKKKYCSFSEKKYVKVIKEDLYDQYIVGSDQVFNLSLTSNDTTFFLPFVTDARKKATYAASLGLDNVSKEQEAIYRNGLEGFTNISIRENSGANIIRKILPEKQVLFHIDPVFLHDKKFWSDIAYSYKTRGKYVLIYSLANEAVMKSVKTAKENYPDYRIYIISDSVSKADPDINNIRGVGPRQFLGLIRDAECVITNSFHGCAFSIIFEKDFFVIPFRNTSSRMVNLLELLGLEDRLLKTYLSIRKEKIDYVTVRERIQSEIDRSRDYFNSIYITSEGK